MVRFVEVGTGKGRGTDVHTLVIPVEENGVGECFVQTISNFIGRRLSRAK